MQQPANAIQSQEHSDLEEWAKLFGGMINVLNVVIIVYNIVKYCSIYNRNCDTRIYINIIDRRKVCSSCVSKAWTHIWDFHRSSSTVIRTLRANVVCDYGG